MSTNKQWKISTKSKHWHRKTRATNQIETQNTKNWNITHPSTTKYNTRGENKCRVDKENHDWKEDYINIPKESRLEKVKVETEKVDKLLPNIPMGNIKLDEQIYAGGKLVCDRISVYQRNPKRNAKPGWEIRWGQVKKLEKVSVKERKTLGDVLEWKD